MLNVALREIPDVINFIDILGRSSALFRTVCRMNLANYVISQPINAADGDYQPEAFAYDVLFAISELAKNEKNRDAIYLEYATATTITPKIAGSIRTSVEIDEDLVINVLTLFSRQLIPAFTIIADVGLLNRVKQTAKVLARFSGTNTIELRDIVNALVCTTRDGGLELDGAVDFVRGLTGSIVDNVMMVISSNRRIPGRPGDEVLDMFERLVVPSNFGTMVEGMGYVARMIAATYLNVESIESAISRVIDEKCRYAMTHAETDRVLSKICSTLLRDDVSTRLTTYANTVGLMAIAVSAIIWSLHRYGAVEFAKRTCRSMSGQELGMCMWGVITATRGRKIIDIVQSFMQSISGDQYPVMDVSLRLGMGAFEYLVNKKIVDLSKVEHDVNAVVAVFSGQ